MAVDLVIPSTPEELQECITDRKKVREIVDGGGFAEFMTNYANTFGKTAAGVDVNANVQDQIDRAIASFAKEHAVELRRMDMRPASAADLKTSKLTGAKWSKHAPGAAIDNQFDNLYDFLEVVHSQSDPREERIGAKRKLIRDAMSSVDPSGGGFLIPEEFRAELMRLSLEQSVVRGRARVLPMSSLRAAIPTIDSTSNASSVFGGVVGYWTEEGGTLTQSQPKFSRVVLEAKKLTAYSEVPNELRQDSAITVDALLAEIFPMAIAWYEDVAFMTGTGAGEPLGVFNSGNSALLSVAAEGGQTTKTIVWENIINIYSRMLPSSLNNAVWVVPPDAFPELATMALSVGTGGAPVWLPAGQDSPYSTLLGRPVIISEKVTATQGTSSTVGGDVNFVDFGQYLIGDRMAMDAQVSVDYQFGKDVTAYRFIERVDGKPWMKSAITPKNSGATLSPYVQLAGR